jgi:hypothetical protein
VRPPWASRSITRMKIYEEGAKKYRNAMRELAE